MDIRAIEDLHSVLAAIGYGHDRPYARQLREGHVTLGHVACGLVERRMFAAF